MTGSKKLFLSCDWGTSSFRLRLIAIPGLRVITEVSEARGIAATYNLWEKENKDDSQRLSFYQNIIKQNIESLEKRLTTSLSGVPLIISGMASSTIGMKELPYKPLPFSLDGSDLLVDALAATESFPHYTVIISGARSADDVMRGEEIQLVGCMDKETLPDQVFIFPGTHSKHVSTCSGQATALKTYMTGELFDLLSTKSILATSVDHTGSFEEQGSQLTFEKGVKESSVHNPLHAFFLVRTNQLFQQMLKEENYYYLSGLLIGLELNDLLTKKPSAVTLVCNQRLSGLYIKALQHFGVNDKFRSMSIEDALIRGHYQVYLRHVSGQ